eukprot:c15426_g1_i1.p1 GENE.c15426_g1_i1~~c15426_g1_i1.p1  ORF type:complete len:636 (+),score=134.15 c15426_g1_i1:30-1910(+)
MAVPNPSLVRIGQLFPNVNPAYLENDYKAMESNEEKTIERLVWALNEDPFSIDKVAWFWRFKGDGTSWHIFRQLDSLKLESAFESITQRADPSQPVSVDSGRFLVDMSNISDIRMNPAYWSEEVPREVVRGTWYFRNSAGVLTPYSANDANSLESFYHTPHLWNNTLQLSDGVHKVVMRGYVDMIQVRQYIGRTVTRQVVRGLPPSELALVRKASNLTSDEEYLGTPPDFEHLVLVVHGIAANYDMTTYQQGDSATLLAKDAETLRGVVNKAAPEHSRQTGCVEVIPINWHKHIHTQNDERMRDITIRRGCQPIRDFINGALIDVLCYMETTQCQAILQTVADQLNAVYSSFVRQHPRFSGNVSIVGHSLGSIISFELLCNQPNRYGVQARPSILTNPAVNYPVLNFQPSALFLLGSPVGMFWALRSQTFPKDLQLPSGAPVYNLFHPFDPIAYRIEPLLDSRWQSVSPLTVLSGNGLQSKIQSALKHIKQKVDSAKAVATNPLAAFVSAMASPRRASFSPRSLWQQYQQTPQALTAQQQQQQQEEIEASKPDDVKERELAATLTAEATARLGHIPHRIDYQLQEKLVENEYLYALASHTKYWSSDDTGAFIFKAALQLPVPLVQK